MQIITEQEMAQDIKYFEAKLLKETNPQARIKIQNQIDLLKDSVVIYKFTRGTECH